MGWKSIVVLHSIFIFGFLENVAPFYSFHKSLTSKNINNLLLGIINIFANSIATALLLNLIWKPSGIWLGFFYAIKSPWLKITLSFLLLDGYMYMWHRLMHTLPLAWRFHQVHHTDMSMNTTTAYRFHAVEVIVSNLPKLFLIWLFGISPSQLLVYEILLAIELVFHHSNWHLPYKIDKYLSYLIVTPNYHRAHHSQLVAESNTNYASFLSIWDRLLKSYYYPPVPKSIKLGLLTVNQELDILSLLTLPLKKPA